MKRLVIVLTVICASVISTRAQMSSGDFHFAAGLELGLPTGDAHTLSSFALGAKLQGEYNFTENVTGVATTGYDHFFGKDLGGGVKVNYGLIPVVVGPRFYPSENFFIGAQIGLGVLTGDASGSGFDYYPQIGYNAESFQAILGYNGVTKNGGTISHVGLTFLYKFGGAK